MFVVVATAIVAAVEACYQLSPAVVAVEVEVLAPLHLSISVEDFVVVVVPAKYLVRVSVAAAVDGGDFVKLLAAAAAGVEFAAASFVAAAAVVAVEQVAPVAAAVVVVQKLK